MLLAVAAACGSETVEVPGETVVVEKEVIKTVEVPGETVVKEVVKEVQVPGETVVVKEEVVKTVEVPGETVVVEKEVVKTVEVPGETIVVEKEVVKTVEVPGETITKEVVKTVEVPGPERVVVKEVRAGYVTDPTTGKVVTKPQYGGTFTFAEWGTPDHVDAFWGAWHISGVVEKLGLGDWALDRDVFAWNSGYRPWVFTNPFGGVESWSLPDPLTIVMKVRKGVYWHDKPPMNGREMTAYDIEYNLHRYLGMGSGFTEVSSRWAGRIPSLESITATDKWTVVFKLGEPQIDALESIVTNETAFMYPPEVIEQYGDAKDWKNLVGTGPFEMVDVVPGSSVTYVKNPNYWGYDEKYPENRLPYVDGYTTVAMFETATKIAAVRSRKLDGMASSLGGWNPLNIDSAESMMRTNPELVFTTSWTMSELGFTVNMQVQPWDDVRVRRALQMAIDLDEINQDFWKGYADTTPETYLASETIGFVVPYEDWPEEIKQYYRYDPEGAEALLDEVGLKRGADGVRIRADLHFPTSKNIDHAYVVKEYWEAIGIEVEMQPLDFNIWHELIHVTHDWEGITYMRTDYSGLVRRLEELSVNYRDGFSWSNWDDPVFDAYIVAVRDAPSIEEQQTAAKEASLYIAEQHVSIWGSTAPWFDVVQPWLGGFNGETDLALSGQMLARLWIDSDLKAAMGY